MSQRGRKPLKTSSSSIRSTRFEPRMLVRSSYRSKVLPECFPGFLILLNTFLMSKLGSLIVKQRGYPKDWGAQVVCTYPSCYLTVIWVFAFVSNNFHSEQSLMYRHNKSNERAFSAPLQYTETVYRWNRIAVARRQGRRSKVREGSSSTRREQPHWTLPHLLGRSL